MGRSNVRLPLPLNVSCFLGSRLRLFQARRVSLACYTVADVDGGLVCYNERCGLAPEFFHVPRISSNCTRLLDNDLTLKPHRASVDATVDRQCV